MVAALDLRRQLKAWFLTLALCLLCSLAFAQNNSAPSATPLVKTLVNRPATYHGMPLQSGQLVVSSGAQVFDLFLLLFEEQFHPYSHVGLVAIEDGAVVVYDAQGGISSTTEDSIGITGGLRRIPFETFLSESGYVELFDLPRGVDANKTLAFAREQFNKKTPYDGVFDSSDASALYCSEYVERALLAGGAQPSARVAFTRNASMRTLLNALRVKDSHVVSVGELVSRSQRLAIVSKEKSFAQMTLDMAVIEELWQRFTPDQKLGALFERKLTSIEYRSDVKQFVAAAQALLESSQGATTSAELSPEQAKSAVQALALRMFGAYQRSLK